jgi:TP901 family phage tail tape measure protein
MAQIKHSIAIDIKTHMASTAAIEKRLKELQRIKQMIEAGTIKLQPGQRLDVLTGNINRLQGALQRATLEAQRMDRATDNTSKNIDKTTAAVERRRTIMQRASHALGQAFLEAPLYAVSFALMNYLNQALQAYIQIDKTLTRIAIVTEKNTDEIRQYAFYANAAGKELGVTGQAFMEASLIFLQQGGLAADYASELAEASIKLSNITGESRDSTSEYVTAIANSFKLLEEAGSEAGAKIVDTLAALDAASGSSANEIAAAMKKSASSMAAAGFSYQETAAMISVISETTRQAPEMIGTGLKTVIGMISEVKVGTKEYGELTSKLQKVSQQFGLTVDIVDQATGDMKSAPRILQEIFQAYNETSSIAAKNALIEAVAGKEQRDRFIALAVNQNRYNELLGVAQNSAGKADAAQQQYLNSIQGKIEQMNAELEELWMNLFDSDLVKWFIDSLTAAGSAFNNLIKDGNGFLNILLQVGSALLVMKSQAIGAGYATAMALAPRDPATGKILGGQIVPGIMAGIQEQRMGAGIERGLASGVLTQAQVDAYNTYKANPQAEAVNLASGNYKQVLTQLYGANSAQYQQYLGAGKGQKGKAFNEIMQASGYQTTRTGGTLISPMLNVMSPGGMSKDVKAVDDFAKATIRAQNGAARMAAGMQFAMNATMTLGNESLTAADKTRVLGIQGIGGLMSAIAPMTGPAAPFLMIGGQLLSMAAGFIGIDKNAQRARDTLNKLQEQSKTQYRDNKEQIEKLADRYDILSKKTSLNAAETEELVYVRNKLAETFSAAKIGEDAFGNAILTSSEALQGQIRLLEKQQQLLDEANKAKELQASEEAVSAAFEQIETQQYNRMSGWGKLGYGLARTFSSGITLGLTDLYGGITGTESWADQWADEMSGVTKQALDPSSLIVAQQQLMQYLTTSGDYKLQSLLQKPEFFEAYQDYFDTLSKLPLGNEEDQARYEEITKMLRENPSLWVQTELKNIEEDARFIEQERKRLVGLIMNALKGTADLTQEELDDYADQLNDLGSGIAAAFEMMLEGLDSIPADKYEQATARIKDIFINLAGDIDNEAGNALALAFDTVTNNIKNIADAAGYLNTILIEFAAANNAARELARETYATQADLEAAAQKASLAFKFFSIGGQWTGATTLPTLDVMFDPDKFRKATITPPGDGDGDRILKDWEKQLAFMQGMKEYSSVLTDEEEKRLEARIKAVGLTQKELEVIQSQYDLVKKIRGENEKNNLVLTRTRSGGFQFRAQAKEAAKDFDYEEFSAIYQQALDAGIDQNILNAAGVVAAQGDFQGASEILATALIKGKRIGSGGGGGGGAPSGSGLITSNPIVVRPTTGPGSGALGPQGVWDDAPSNDVLLPPPPKTNKVVLNGVAAANGSFAGIIDFLENGFVVENGEEIKVSTLIKNLKRKMGAGHYPVGEISFEISENNLQKILNKNFSYSFTPPHSRDAVTFIKKLQDFNPSITALAKGGLINGSIFANIGEAGRELVLPLERNTGWVEPLLKVMNKDGGMGQQVNVTNYITLPNATDKQIENVLNGMSNATTQWINKRRSF